MKRFIALSMLAIASTLTVMPPADAQSCQTRDIDRAGSYCGANFNAGRCGGQINSTQAQLQDRINLGVKNGRLNQREAARLQTKLAQIAQLEARMRATGNRLTFSERTKLNNQLAKLNREITKELNDFDRRGVAYWTSRLFR